MKIDLSHINGVAVLKDSTGVIMGVTDGCAVLGSPAGRRQVSADEILAVIDGSDIHAAANAAVDALVAKRRADALAAKAEKEKKSANPAGASSSQPPAQPQPPSQ